MWQRVQMSEILQNYICACESFSVSGKENAAQGGDFHQEELNKCINAFSVQLCPQKTSGRKSVLFPLLILLL